MLPPPFSVVRTRANGDCLFDSVSHCLNSIGLSFSPHYLRQVVAYSILDVQSATAKNIVQQWYQLYHQLMSPDGDKSLLREYAFMQPAHHQPLPLSLSTLSLISRQMMQPALYWGEEYALRVFERQLQVRFLIWEQVEGNRFRLHTPLDHNDLRGDYRPTHYILLYLQQKHYQPLSYSGQYVFTPHSLPSSLQTMMQEATRNNGYISSFPVTS